MFYSYALMPRYADRELEDEIERKPYWCVVAQYELGESQFESFERGTNYLTGRNLEFLTMAEARRKCEELDSETFAVSAERA